MKSVNGNYQEIFDADCSLDDKPAVRKDCNATCPPSWFATPWTKVNLAYQLLQAEPKVHSW